MAQGAWALDEIKFANRSWNGSQVKETTEAITDYVVFLNSSTLNPGQTGHDKYWVVLPNQDITVSDLMTIHGEVHIVLCDGATLRCKKGIQVNESDGAVLYIHSQSYGEQMGRLIATGDDEKAGIGGSEGAKGGTIHIMGGHIEATGGELGAGIGAGAGTLDNKQKDKPSEAGPIYIYGGTVTATGGEKAAGIGGGAAFESASSKTGSVTIYDGTVTARGANMAAGVGGGCKESDGSSQGGGGGGGHLTRQQQHALLPNGDWLRSECHARLLQAEGLDGWEAFR